jgi:hypothetical protein
LLRLWQHLITQSRRSANPLKKSLFSRCVNPIASNMRGDGAPKGAPWYQCRRMIPGSPETRGSGNALRRSIAAISVRGTVLPGTGWSFRSRPDRLSPALCPTASSHLRQSPNSGPGRLPPASRVCVCETQPQAPHPTGLGYPAPAKLSLCPTSERLMKRPSPDRTRSA